jgi:hypothetical protein
MPGRTRLHMAMVAAKERLKMGDILVILENTTNKKIRHGWHIR